MKAEGGNVKTGIPALFVHRALVARVEAPGWRDVPKSCPLHFSDIAYSLITQCPRLGPSQVWGAGAWITRAEHPARNAFPGGGA